MRTFVSCTLLAVAVVALGRVAGAQTASMPPGGSVMGNPVNVVNLYWDGSWDGDHAGFFSSGPQPTSAAIDAFVTALKTTPVSFFAKTAQYRPDGAPFAIGTVTSRVSVGACSPTTPPAVVDAVAILNWVTCEANSDNSVPRPSGANDTLYIVYLPAATRERNRIGNFDSCSGSTLSFAGYHSSQPLQRWPYVVIPVTCAAGFGALTSTIAHEMVEAMTDPSDSGWRMLVPTTVTIPFVPAPIVIPVNNEIADPPCNATTAAPVFFGLTVTTYWSNSDRACVVGSAPIGSFGPSITVNDVAPLLSNSTGHLSVTPSGTPVAFTATVANGDPVNVARDGTVTVGDIRLDHPIPVLATALDGSGSTASGSIRVLAPLRIDPIRSEVNAAPGRVVFNRTPAIQVTWSRTGPGYITLSEYRFPAIYQPQFATVTATALDGSGRTASATVHFTGLAQAADKGYAIPAGQAIPLDAYRPGRIYPGRPSLKPQISPPLGSIRNGAYIAPTRAELEAAHYRLDRAIPIHITTTDATGKKFTQTITIAPLKQP